MPVVTDEARLAAGMPVTRVMPLAEKPADCEHLAYEVLGTSKLPGDQWREHRRCADCRHNFVGLVDVPPEEPEAEPGKPPKATYGHAQVISYQTEEGQHELVVGEMAIVSVQSGAMILQHPSVPILGIVGVRPWLEVADAPAAD